MLAAQPGLTLPLARLLVRLQEARAGLKTKKISPSDLAARLVLLADEAELPAADIDRYFVQQPRNLAFKLIERARLWAGCAPTLTRCSGWSFSTLKSWGQRPRP